MPQSVRSVQAALPSVDRILGLPDVGRLIERHGRTLVTETARSVLAAMRADLATHEEGILPDIGDEAIAANMEAQIAALLTPPLTPVFNLTGTVLHTNLGRAPLPEEALDAMARVARGASNLEYDIQAGKRGDRDSHLEDWVRRLTGAEAATVVNNNAAAVLLLLNSLALRKEVPVSRGELIEIGGAFRIPDIMARAGAKLVEVGTTNRTHSHDFQNAIGPRTALIMKVHTSNYEVQGFTAAVEERDLAALAHDAELPLAVDLGSGTLVDLRPYSLPHEPTVAETLQAGADLVTFSGDKLLGGPQAGLVVGRADLVAKVRKNPMKRAMRLDKVTIAALEAILRLYTDPDRLAERLPTIGLLARPKADIAAAAERVCPAVAKALEAVAIVEIVDCRSQIGSGSLPVDRLDSAALSIRPRQQGRGEGKVLTQITEAFRDLPSPVIGRVQEGALILDLRCLTDEAAFAAQLERLNLS
ncbi:MAG: L-seryl-tRNA(Sec) selenium transferase [Minwuiales bacterium]|nr:L-seryl-tRNA(Sec) selenium transferase [Minwuiales bacterium]